MSHLSSLNFVELFIVSLYKPPILPISNWLVIRLFENFLDALRTCAVILFSLSGFGEYINSNYHETIENLILILFSWA